MNNTETLSKTGKQFYTWSTLGSFGGAVVVVTVIWNVLISINQSYFDKNVVVLAISLFILLAFAVLTEPSKNVEQTTWRQKGQKGLITVLNGCLVYNAVLGFSITA